MEGQYRNCVCGNVLLILSIISIVTGGMSQRASHSQSFTIPEDLISKDTTWTLINSPYVIASNITVVRGATLTIETGVLVRLGDDYSINVNGSLCAAGTNNSPITFTSNKSSPKAGDWDTINFAGADNESFTMRNCVVEYAKCGITIQSLGKATVENSRIYSNSFSGIHVTSESNLTVKSNTIALNKNGISSNGSITSGIRILNNTVDSNENGIYLYASDSETCRIAGVTISDNVFSSNFNGIQFMLFPSWLAGTINNVTICRNTITLNKKGICLYIWGGYVDFATNLIYDVHISDNTVHSNEEYGIYLYSGGPWLGSIHHVTISNNKILSSKIGAYLFANTHHPTTEYDVLMSNNTVSANSDKGIHVSGGVAREPEEGIKTNATRNSISYNTCGVLYEGDTDNAAIFNDIHHNTYGIHVVDGATANATNNYWGAPTGPYHSRLNPDGKGNAVNGDGTDLIFEPFLTRTVVNKRPLAVLETDAAKASTNQIVTFNASKSSDDGSITRYSFDFGDGVSSGWIAQSAAKHAYTLPGIYEATLKVLDDLGFESNNTAFVSLMVCSTLSISITPNSELVESGKDVIITILATDELNLVSDVNVTLLSDGGGVFSPETGKTDSAGYFTSMFTAPTVTEEVMITITANATKIGYWNGQGQTEVNVLPKDATSGTDFVLALAAIAVIALVIVSILKIRKMRRSKSAQSPHRPVTKSQVQYKSHLRISGRFLHKS